MMNVRVTELESGLRVVSQPMAESELVSLGLWVKAGSRHEGRAQNGIAHFLEHMAFKGTSQRSALEIVEDIEQVGGDLNAATGIDQTAYYAQVLGGSLDVAVELIADIVLNPVFRAEDIGQEASVIVQEILASEDQPEEAVFEQALLRAFPGQAVGRPVMGQIETVRGFSRQDLQEFMGRHYRGKEMVLAACGDVAHDRLVELAARHFDKVQSGNGGEIEPADYAGGLVIDDSRSEQGHVVIGFEGVGFCSDDIFTGQILNTVLGGGMSSRLFQEVRERRGLAYHVYSFHSTFEDGGLLGAYAGTEPGQTLELAKIMLAEMQQMGENGISERELMRAKAQLECGLAMVGESSSARAEQLARQLLFFGRPLQRDELLGQLNTVSVEDCRKLASRCILEGRLCLSVLGAGQKHGEFDRLYKGWESGVKRGDVKRAAQTV